MRSEERGDSSQDHFRTYHVGSGSRCIQGLRSASKLGAPKQGDHLFPEMSTITEAIDQKLIVVCVGCTQHNFPP